MAHRLLDWHRSQPARPYPWRDEPRRTKLRTPYRVWVAEVMLQQTQTGTAGPYYERFLARFPTVEALAAASLDDVLKAWEGLGYYARARNLHRAARQVVAAGEFPATYEGWRALPGVGDYTAGAVLSLAFGQDVPAVDGNGRRVLARLCVVEDDVTRPATHHRLRAIAAELLPTGRAGAFNEALMDLGATVCTPRTPRCGECPWAADCLARAQGRTAALPVRAPRRQIPHYDVTAAVIQRDGRLLIAQRRPDDMLGGLWEFPGGKREPGESLPNCLRRELREELDIEVAVGDLLTTIPHAYTHFRITLHAFWCTLVAGEPRPIACADVRWVRPDELDAYAFPVTDQRIIVAVRVAARFALRHSAPS
ncbi:MAG: A/G-specific adenine glycosylase [Chloroflexi bacterium]|nr:A/G-specific adenine glycosylase [Chloroflexota bacterium]MBU1747538.1 A/G-specific adenine glycosylase [Chloroflexota bacterium]MBU1880238.1 A/G-specific adenine glycosylase [Chloroflexota bacterium]